MRTLTDEEIAGPVTPEQARGAAATANFGKPSARKGGRHPERPYVPVLLFDEGLHQSSQVLGLAYATREEAVAAAERHVHGMRASLERRLLDPRHRALREQYGLPRELS